MLGGMRALSLRRLVGIAAGRTTIRVGSPLSSLAKHNNGFRKLSSATFDCSSYPCARKDDSVVDDYHGHKIRDPYRYMENPDGEETKQFVDQLNEISAPFIEKSEHRDDCRKRLNELWNYEKFTCTSKKGSHYYYSHNSGLQNQYVTYQSDAVGTKGKVFFDPNTLSEDGTTSLTDSSFTRDGSLFAYGLSESGSDWMTIKFKTASGEDLPDVIPGAKFSGISWTGDNKGVFYCRYPNHKGTTEGTSAEKHEWHSLYYHKMGTKAEEDVLVYKRTDNPDMMIQRSTVTDDGRFLILSLCRGADPCNMLYYYDLKAVGNKITGPIDAVPLVDTLEAKYDYIDHDGDTMIIRTNKDAPMFKIVTMSLKEGRASQTDLIPENDKSSLAWAVPIIGGRLLVSYFEDVKSTLYMHEASSGRRLYQLPLEIGTISGLHWNKMDNELFLAFESFLVPMIEYRMDFGGVPIEKMPEMKETRRTHLNGMEKEAFKVEQVFYPSKDGTKIPMFIISNSDMPRTGETPMILDGYGGFGVPYVPYFDVSRLLFVRHFGGAWVISNLRGGGEYGEAWHEAGMKEKKQNVFDDFISASEYLVNEKITKPEKLTIIGGSNGGLLMGAVSQQRPELFGCVVNAVGVLDMLRFHKFTIGAAWMPEYGCPDVKEDFEHIFKYSPLHNVAIPADGQWPATLLMTADHDDRVVPSHTLKYIATLYEKAKAHGKQSNPIMARVEVKAGHGSGKPTSKIILGGQRALSLRRLFGYGIASGRTTPASMCLIGLMARGMHSRRRDALFRASLPLASTTFAKYPHGFRMCSTAIDCSTYPCARKDDAVVDDYHGHKICDPYRYMENPDGEETKQFVDQLNAISAPFIEKSEHREDCRKRLTELWNYEKFTVTSKRGKHYYYKHNTGLQNQYVTYQTDAVGTKGKVFFDPNTLSEDGTTFLRAGSFTKDGTLYAYGLSEKGSDWMTIQFKTAEGEDLPDKIPGAKFSGIAWTGDKTGVFYSKYPQHKGATEGTSAEKHEWHSLYYHKMGTKSEEDVLVYKRTDNPDMMIDGEVTDDGRFLIISAARGCDPFNMLYYYDLKAVDNKITGPIEAVPLFDTLEAKYEYIDHDEEKMIIRTNKGAPMFKIMTMSLKEGSSSLVDLIPENPKANLEWACPLIGGRLVVGYIEDVKAALYMHEQSSGRRLYQIPLDIGTVSGFYADKDENELFLAFESFLVPMIEYRMDFAGVPIEKMPEMKEIRRVQINGMEKETFKVEQVFYPSKDGTKIPMYIISNASMQRNGENPVILNGYGGFNVADMPYFSVSRLLFVRHFGGVYACANLRGGSEYGEAWHEAGMKGNKQNVFDDFISAGEYLVKENITKPAKLTIHGGSNGGLLVGACSQQRPDLFGCAINRVGVLDMLRYHKFTIGGAWVPEYGCADVKEDFDVIYKYSPLHNLAIPEGGQWPATLLMTADHDDRVVPSHTLKYIATLYEKAKAHGKQSNPIMARVEVKAGHGAGKPTSKIIAEQVDLYAFIQRVVGLKWYP